MPFSFEPRELDALESLTQLRLNNNRLRGRVPDTLKFLMNLRERHLHNNQLEEERPEGERPEGERPEGERPEGDTASP